MATRRAFRLRFGKSPKAIKVPARPGRKPPRAHPLATAPAVARALKATAGSKAILARVPSLLLPAAWLPTASFSCCGKTGTARYLDIWDADHFDGFTDMAAELRDCRVWFAADGYTAWDSPQTRTGRVNCYFKAPAAGNYVCNARLESFNGPARVQCLIDAFNFGPLPFNGLIDQPHPCALSAGYHNFRIRQDSGSFFFLSLTVWKV